jgi:hypothetical protein
VRKLLHTIFILCSICGSLTSHAQENEEQLQARAAKNYAAENYVAASRDYIQLLAIQPRDPLYNYRYGTCLLYNSHKKQDAIRYLEYASKAENMEPEVFFYLGKAYHLNYQFNDAIRLYTQYKTKAGTKAKAELETDRQIEMCQNGKRLLTTLTDIIVLEKVEIETDKFFRIYDLSNIGGVILVTTDFQSRIDKKKGHVPLVHFPPKASMIFYASYGESESNGKDIYYRTKLSNGSWSSPFIVKGYVNSGEDEDFAYMDPAGNYLYFSSKGHNSMGGSDIFRSKYNSKTNEFGAPENLDFAISSPDNDLFYVVDSLDKNAYFASSRQSADGKIHVYKVRVDRIPLQVAAVKGAFSSMVRPQQKKMTVEVADAVSGTKLGVFASDDAGNFLITFPKGGKYKYNIKIEGAPHTFEAAVNIPVLREFKPLKQHIQHEMQQGNEVVRIVDLFDEAVDDPAGVLAEIVKMRSELNPNADQFDLKALDQQQPVNGAIYGELGLDNKSALVIRETIAELAEKQSAQVASIESLQQKALGEVAQNAGKIESLQSGTKALANKANTEKDPLVKSGLYSEAASKIEKISELQVTSKRLLAYHDSLQQLKTGQEQEAQTAQQLSQRVAETAKDSNPDALTQVLQENKNAIQDLQQKPGALPVEILVEQVLQTKSDIQKRQAKAGSYQVAGDQLQQEINGLQTSLEQAKSKDKPAIQQKIDSKKQEQGLVQEEIDLEVNKAKTLHTELQNREAQLEYTQAVSKQAVPAQALTAQDVRNTFSALDNPNARTLYSYVQQQQQILAKDPAVMAAAQATATENQGSGSANNSNYAGNDEIVARQSTYRRRLQEIEADEALSQAEKRRLSEQTSAAFETELQAEIVQTENILAQNPSDAAARAKRENLQKTKAEVKVQLAETQEKIEQQGRVAIAARTETQIEKLKPGHNSKLEAIAANPKLTTAEKTAQSQKEDAALLKPVQAEIKRQEAAVKADPQDQEKQQTLQALENIRETTLNRVAAREKAAASENNSVANTHNGGSNNQTSENNASGNGETGNDASESTSLTVATFQPEHVSKTKAIAENPKLSPRDKQQQLIQQEAKLQKSIDAALKKASQELSKNPQDVALATRVTDLQALKDESQARTEESRQVIVSDLKTQIKESELQQQIDPKYTQDLQAINVGASEEQPGKSIARETALQSAIDKKLAANNAELARKDTPELSAQNQVLNELKDASQLRIDAHQETIAAMAAAEADTNQIEETILTPVSIRLRDYLAIDEKYFESTYTASEDLADQQDKLGGYLAVLERLQEENEDHLSRDPSAFYKEDQRVLAAEKTKTEAKLNQVNQQISAAEKAAADPTPVEIPVVDPKQQKLQEQEEILQQQLAQAAAASAEREKIEKAIAANQLKQTETANAAAQQQWIQQQQIQTEEAKALQKYAPKNDLLRSKSEAILQETERSQQEMAVQQKAIAAEKDPLAKQALIEQLVVHQEKQASQLSALQLDHALDKAADELKVKNAAISVYALESTKDLESRKYRALIQVGELTAQKAGIGEQVSATKSGKPQQALIAQQKEIQQHIDILQTEVNTVEQILEKRRQPVTPLVSEKALAEPLTHAQEQALAASESYKVLFEAIATPVKTLEKLQKQEEQLEKLQQQHNLKLLQQLENLSGNISSADEVTAIYDLQQEMAATRQQYEAQQKEIQKLLDQTTDAMKIQNLLARGIQPITKLAIATAIVPVSSQGSTTVKTPVVAPVEKVMPVSTNAASGLVYRVQVGAFSKPISEEKFKEFKPVSGEKLPNGVTRYLAGAFNSRESVAKAQQQIRAIGYKDAFPVAYCNGERITMEEARQLQESGRCVPQLVDQAVVAEDLRQTVEVPVVEAIRPQPVATAGPGAYNVAPGAARATAAETRLGLFYTVQLGVYNKPVPPAQLKNIEPLVTQRLENGQIRYSAGMFQSQEAAQPKKLEAQLRGITDAFITAYYKGERISLTEAHKLLEQQGSGILEKLTAADTKVASQPEIERSIADPALRDTSIVFDNAAKVQLQLVSKKTYDTYPRDIVRRFNDKGFFYYDESDRHVKSIIYADADHLPQIYYFRNELDTVIVSPEIPGDTTISSVIHAFYPQPVFDGAAGDWLMRLSYQRHLYAQEGKIILEITGIADEATRQELVDKLRGLGFEITL